MEQAIPEKKDPFDEPYVRRRPVRILRRGPLKQYEDLRIWIAPNSTYAYVKDQLVLLGHQQVTVLQAHFGPKTFWNNPSLNCLVESTCQNLYALVDTLGPYLLGVVRTPVADCIVPIFSPGRPAITVLEAIIAAQPSLAANIKSIHDYTPNGPDISSDLLSFHLRLHRSRFNTFPTFFFVTVHESIGGFLPELPPGSIPPILQLPFAHYKHLLQEVNRLVRDSFRQQMNQLLQAACHTLVAFAQALKRLFDDKVPDLEAALEQDDSLVELLPVVPVLTLQLKQVLDRIEQTINDGKNLSMDWDIPLQTRVHDILITLCGDFPGAVVNRHSYRPLPSSTILPMSISAGLYERGEADIQASHKVPIRSDLATQDYLRDLSLEDRDIAELFKTKLGNLDDGVFNPLHQRNTTAKWRALDEEYRQMAPGQTALNIQELVKEPISPLLSWPAIPSGQRPPKGVVVVGRGGRALRVPTENNIEAKSYSTKTDKLDFDSRTDSESVSQPPSTRRPASVGEQLVALDFLGEFDEDGEEDGYADEDDDAADFPPRRHHRRGEQADESGTVQPAGVKFTQEHHDAMVRFVYDLNREPIKDDWENFRMLSSHNQLRSADTWRRRYYKERKAIHADILRMRA